MRNDERNDEWRLVLFGFPLALISTLHAFGAVFTILSLFIVYLYLC